MIDSILFACDFSSPSEQAFAYGTDLAERTGASLHCLHVQEVAMGPFVAGNPSPEGGKKALQSKVKKKCQAALGPHLRESGVGDISYVAERSSAVAPTVVEYAGEHDIDLIVMGTQGRRGVRRALFGSVAEEVLRTAPCPVLTARAPAETSVREVQVSRIVAPVDFSAPSRGALRYAARLRSVYDVPLTLLHVVELPKIPTVYEVEFSGASSEQIAARVDAALSEWAESMTEDGAVTTVVEEGDPVDVILRVADAPTDLVVMASRGTSGMKRSMLGSVAEGVLREAAGPVISSRTFSASGKG